jgi:hypothetical protein
MTRLYFSLFFIKIYIMFGYRIKKYKNTCVVCWLDVCLEPTTVLQTPRSRDIYDQKNICIKQLNRMMRLIFFVKHITLKITWSPSSEFGSQTQHKLRRTPLCTVMSHILLSRVCTFPSL